jgi:hypothetical protein
VTALERIAAILEKDGYPVNLAEAGGRGAGPLFVAFRPDDRGREMVLVIDVVAAPEQGGTGVIGFSLLYPYFIPDPTALPELIRLLFLLSRLLPIGSHGLSEETPGIYFQYRLLVQDPDRVDEAVIKDAVGMIGLFTREHGTLIDQVLDGRLDCDTLVSGLEAAGKAPGPILGPAFKGAGG